MSAIMVYYENEWELQEVNEVLKNFNHLSIYPLSKSDFSLDKINNLINENEAHILLCAKTLDDLCLHNVDSFYKQNPFFTFIYFNTVLKDGDFSKIHKAGFSYCIVVNARHINLKLVLQKLIDDNWKKIPEDFFEKDLTRMSSKAKSIVEYIETHPINKFNITSIAKFIEISPSHLRKEFKKIFNSNFRTFKQKLLSHYEDILLLEKKFMPHHIFKILDYKNLSAFSRSFKTRHGKSWRTIVKD